MKETPILVEKFKNRQELAKGKFFTLLQDEVELPDASIGIREWIPHQGAAAIVPILPNGDVLLIQQFRYPVGKTFLEVPAGKIDPEDVSPLQTAQRELQEETGFRAEKWIDLGHFYPTIGYSNEVIHLFLATELSTTHHSKEVGEFVHPIQMPFWEAVEKAHAGYFEDGKSMIALIRAGYFWKNQVKIGEDIASLP